MHARLSLLLLILLAGASSSVLALQMPIYEGTAVLAAGQDEQDDGALRAALTNVLMKVSGDRSVTTDAGLGSVLGDARRIALTVRRFQMSSKSCPIWVFKALATSGRFSVICRMCGAG